MTGILITGANRGIGLGMVRECLRRESYTVYATCRQPDEAADLHDLKSTHGDRLHIVQLDVTDGDSIAGAVETVRQHTDALDVLVNNAGVNLPGQQQTFDSMTADKMLSMFRVNVAGPLLVTRAFLDLLKNGDDATVVNVSSQMGSLEWKNSGGYYGYSPSKAALNMVTRLFAADLKPHGITSITTHPGWVQTDMGGENANLTPEESARGMIDLIENTTPANNGGFYRWDGSEHPW
jgi:NAD(P)-dependent dehydrogenase (short-subunit alcohol dehydrogenase family)